MDFNPNSPFAALIPQFDAIVAQVKDIDTTLAGLAGTHAARKASALEAIVAKELAAHGIDTLTDAAIADLDLSESPALAFRRAVTVLEAAKVAHDDAKSDLDDAVNAALRADKSANTTERDAFLTTRETLVTGAAAMATLIAGASKPLTPTDIGLAKPKGSGSSSGTPRTAKVGQGVFSYRRDGDAEWTVPCDAQQSLSATAYRVFGRAGVGELREAMAAVAGDKVDETKDFESTVTVRDITATVKFTVTEAPATEG